MLALNNINVSFAQGTQLERHILRNINLQVSENEILIVVGGNGAGKSTMFNVINGIVKPYSGSIMVDGKDISSISQSMRSADIAMVMQDPKIGTMEHLTIFENMSLAVMRGKDRSLKPIARGERRKLFIEKLSMLGNGLENRLDELVINLSGGQRQALSLIMAVLTTSKVLLLDEITAALDPNSAANIMKLTNEIIKSEKRSAIMITHNMEDAIKYGDRLIILKNGAISKEFSAIEKSSLTANYLNLLMN